MYLIWFTLCVGPTHDDVTLKAIAAAFGQEITVSKEMIMTMEDGPFMTLS